MSCPCDRLVHPEPLRIDAGLETIPRRIAGFPEFRRAMLADLGEHGALADWRAREDDDLGVMLLEMWAYVCDVLAFYDETIAHEAYLRTARRRPSLRSLVELVGHLPRPAVGTRVVLAAMAEGDRPVELPAGTAFRSKAFDGEAPQVFELEHPATIHSAHNRWRIEPRRPATLGEALDGGGDGPGPRGSEATLRSDEVDSRTLSLRPDTASLDDGDALVVRWGETDDEVRAARVDGLESVEGPDGEVLLRVELRKKLRLPGSRPPDELKLLRPTQRAGLWAGTPMRPALRLDGLYPQIRAGDPALVVSGDGADHLSIVETAIQAQVPLPGTGGTTSIVERNAADEKTGSFDVAAPTLTMPVTELTLSTAVPATWSNDGSVVVHHGLVEAGELTVPASTRLDGGGPTLAGPDGGGAALVAPDGGSVAGARAGEEEIDPPSKVLLEDARGLARDVGASVDLEEGTLSDLTDPSLTLPLDVFGNRLVASRGETVEGEVLGRGDGSVEQPSFTLQKKPLTYLPAPTAEDENAVAPALEVRVDGIRWRRMRTFFGTDPEDPVYIVRQNDDGESVITFRGPLPTDAEVVASYRFGAGAAAPPPGSVSQLAKPVEGLRSVRNPLAAFGGGDPEEPEDLRTAAPRSALLLGRAVSLADFEARAANQTGVRSVRVGWRWQRERQRPGVLVWYVGEEGIQNLVAEALRMWADPAVSIEVRRAGPVPLRLFLDVEVDPDHPKDAVLRAICRALVDPDEGLLSPERIGIGTPLFRSRIFERTLRLEGVISVDGIRYDVAPFGASRAFTPVVLDPRAHGNGESGGSYFDLEAGGLVVNGREDLCD